MMKVWNVRTGAAVAVAAVAFTLIGCTGTGNVATGNSDDGGSSLEGTELTVWAANYGTSLEQDAEVLSPHIKDFESETGATVNLEVVPWSDLLTRIQTSIVSGQGPDVVQFGSTWLPAMAATGAFVEFEGDALEAVGGLDRFAGGLIPSEFPPISVPTYSTAFGLYYNKQMFADAGLEPPATWEAMVDAAERLTGDGVSGIAAAAGGWAMNSQVAVILSGQEGGNWFDGEEPTFATDENVRAVFRWVDLMQQGYMNSSNAEYTAAIQSSTDFANGKAAMILNQNNALRVFRESGFSTDEYGVVPVPAPAGGISVSTPPLTAGLSIMNSTKNLSGSLAFVRAMTQESVLTTFGEPFSVLSVLDGVESNFSDNPEENKTFTTISAEMSTPWPSAVNSDQYEQLVGNAMNAMFANIATGGTVTEDDVRQMLEDAQAQVAG